MDTPLPTRRASDLNGECIDTTDTEMVRHGILLQALSNSVAAVEYLDVRGVEPATIRRVLGGERRKDDQAAVSFAAPSRSAR